MLLRSFVQNPDDPEASARFQAINAAYEVRTEAACLTLLYALIGHHESHTGPEQSG